MRFLRDCLIDSRSFESVPIPKDQRFPHGIAPRRFMERHISCRAIAPSTPISASVLPTISLRNCSQFGVTIVRTLEETLRTFVTTPRRGNATTKYHNNKEPDQSDPGSRKQTRSSTINSEGAPDTLAELGNRCRGLCGKLEPDSKSDHFDANRAFACLPGSRCSAGCQTLHEAIDASRQTRVHPHQHKPRGEKAKHRTDHCGPPGSSMSID